MHYGHHVTSAVELPCNFSNIYFSSVIVFRPFLSPLHLLMIICSLDRKGILLGSDYKSSVFFYRKVESTHRTRVPLMDKVGIIISTSHVESTPLNVFVQMESRKLLHCLSQDI